jgi:hypothetical protein
MVAGRKDHNHYKSLKIRLCQTQTNQELTVTRRTISAAGHRAKTQAAAIRIKDRKAAAASRNSKAIQAWEVVARDSRRNKAAAGRNNKATRRWKTAVRGSNHLSKAAAGRSNKATRLSIATRNRAPVAIASGAAVETMMIVKATVIATSAPAKTSEPLSARRLKDSPV